MTENDINKEAQLSVVMVVHDQEDLLEQHLPQFLSQPSKTSYEVIVVDDSSTDRTPDILKKMKEEYPQLHTTFFPKSVPNPSRIQLALNIGIKATHGEWIVLADINRPPTSAEWIDGLINNDAEVTMVYSTTKHPEEVRHQSWERLEDAFPLIYKTERRDGKGHKGSCLKHLRGIYDAIAVCRHRIYDAVRQYDRRISRLRLLELRMQVAWNNLMN